MTFDVWFYFNIYKKSENTQNECLHNDIKIDRFKALYLTKKRSSISYVKNNLYQLQPSAKVPTVNPSITT